MYVGLSLDSTGIILLTMAGPRWNLSQWPAELLTWRPGYIAGR